MKKTALFFIFFLFFAAGFSAAQSITLTSPAAGDSWAPGTSHDILWTIRGTMDDEVKILLFQSGRQVMEIAARVPNSGRFTWLIPNTVAPGSYKVRVRTIDNAVRGNSGEFGIAAPAQPAPQPPDRSLVAIVEPNGGESIQIGRSFRIRWNAPAGGAADRTVDLLICRDGRPVGVVAENLPIMQRNFEWTAGRLLAGSAGPNVKYKMRIRVDGTTIEDDSDRSFELVEADTAAEDSGTEGDLELVALEQAQNKVVARIRSTFPRFAGTAMYEMRRPNWAPTPIFRYPLSMLFEGPGEKVYTMETIVPTRPMAEGFCISDYEMYLDITNLVEETNELNNHKTADLYGNPTFVIIERVVWGGQDMVKGMDNSVRSGRVVNWASGMPRSVMQTLFIYVRNCGYMPINEGELRVTQIGVLGQERPQMAPTFQTRELWHRMIGMSAFGEQRHHMTAEIPFDPSASDIRVEYIWEGAGLHTDHAVFTFHINYRDLF